MLVQASDGLFYKGLIGSSNLGVISFIDQPSALVPGPMASSRRKANALLRDLGISGRLLEAELAIGVVNSRLVHGVEYDFKLRAAPMLNSSWSWEAYVSSPTRDAECIGFWSDFWKTDLLDVMEGRLRIPLLERALLGEWMIDTPLLRRRLFRLVKTSLETIRIPWRI